MARVDLDRTRLHAEMQTNFVPRSLGSMMLRPGLGYKDTTFDNSEARLCPFVFSATDTALLEFTSTRARMFVNPQYGGGVVIRSAVSASATNGTFTTDLTGWTDADDNGASSTWIDVKEFSLGGHMGLEGLQYSAARRRQEIAVPTSDVGTEHGIRVEIHRGPVNIKIGSTVGLDDYMAETAMDPGTYSFCVVPTTNIHIELSAKTRYVSLVRRVAIEHYGTDLGSSGELELPADWSTSDLGNLRWSQSGDIVYLACGSSVAQQKVSRFGSGSSTSAWAINEYIPDDGPFRTINTTQNRIYSTHLNGVVRLFSDVAQFSTNDVGALYRLTSGGQAVSSTFAGADQWTDAIRVTGTSTARQFDIDIISASSTTATVRVQRSIGEEGSWVDVDGLSYTTAKTTNYDDGFDNQIVFYRVGVGSTDFTSGTASARLDYAGGGKTGVARVYAITSSTSEFANKSTGAWAYTLTPFGSTEPTELWEEGEWSQRRGYPSAVSFHEGRLWWAGKSKVWGSVSDGYESFDPDTEGDSGPINRSIGAGPVDRIRWLQSLGRLIIGTEGRELQAKTSSLEEPLTPTNFNLRDVSTQGSGNVQAVKIDHRTLFVQQGGTRVMEIGEGDNFGYRTVDRTILVPEIGEPEISRMAVQRQPDTRVHCVRTDGTVGLLVSDPGEDVAAWVDIETNGDGIEEVAVLPNTVEDAVFYVSRREVDGSTKRYIEQWAKESEARGEALNKVADSFVTYEGTAATVITGLDHLVGETVVAWGSTKDLGEYTVSSTGEITLTEESSSVVVGLGYDAWYKSGKLAYLAESGTALTKRKRVDHIGLVLKDTHARGILYGGATSTDNSHLDPMPAVEDGTSVSTDTVHEVYDETSFPFDGSWDSDSRVVLKGSAPRPATVLGLVVDMDTRG